MANREQYRYCPVCSTHLSLRAVDGTPRHACENCGYIRFRNPSPSTGVVAIMDGRIVMIRRGRPPALGKWAFPSGFIELGETPEQAALREMEEESGVTGEILDLIGVFHEHSQVWGDILVITYLVRVTAGELRAGCDADDVRLFNRDEIPEFKFESFRRTWERAMTMFDSYGIVLR